MIDFHTHLLPNVDDGVTNIDEAIKIIRSAYDNGFSDIVLTPHYIVDQYEQDKYANEKKIEILQKKIKEENININLYLGNEIFFTPNIIELLSQWKASTINNSNYLLFELPYNKKVFELNKLIIEIQKNKLIPILAHPERYRYIQKDFSILKELEQSGVLMQAEFGSIIGMYGRKSQNVIKRMLSENLVQFMGSDTHFNNIVYRKMGKIRNNIIKIIGEDKFVEITQINPKLVLENKKIII